MAPYKIPVSGVYCIKNLITGQVYVGSSISIYKRWSAHRLLGASWITYGEAAFDFEILEHVADKSLLVSREQHWITVLNSSLNCCPNAGSPVGRKSTPASRARMSISQRGKTMPPMSMQQREAIRVARTGTKRSPETCAKMSAARKGKKLPPRSPEWCAAISVAAKGRVLTPEHRAALSAALKGRPRKPR